MFSLVRYGLHDYAPVPIALANDYYIPPLLNKCVSFVLRYHIRSILKEAT